MKSGKMSTRKAKIDFTILNQQTGKYFYPGYDLYFMHGWFSSYLSAPSESEEDLVIPTYLVFDEDKDIDEASIAAFVDDLMYVYSDISDSIYEKNRQIKPLGSLLSPNDFSVEKLDKPQKIQLLTWLYGYICGYLVIGADISEYCQDERLLEDKFYPALYTVCAVFLLLEQSLNPESLFSATAFEDFQDVKADILDMWEDEGGQTILDEIKEINLDDALSDFINALNTIFYVIRVSDEARFAANNQNSLLKSLVVH